MGYLVKMPKLSMQMESGELLEWHVPAGGEVSAGTVLAEVESEKSIGEIEAREDGVLRRVYLEAGERTEPGLPIGIVARADEDITSLEAAAEDAGVAVEASPADTEPEPADAAEDDGASAADAATQAATGDDEPARVTPAARRRARELEVAVEDVAGSGPKGAVTSEDIERAAATAGDAGGSTAGGDPRRNDASPRARRRAEAEGVDLATVRGSGPDGAVLAADVEAAAAGDVADRGVLEERELDGMRRAISDRLGRSYREAVHVTHHRTVDAEALLRATDVADAALDGDVTLNDLLLCAVSEALADHPAFNATFEDDRHRLHDEHRIGVAVDIDGGLIAPVLDDVREASIETISARRRDVTERALSGEYTMDDLAGGTFTVSNLGPFGIEAFTPIINPPQVAILGVNAIQNTPVRDGDGVAFRRELPLSLSFDHRVVDGADAARFLETLADRIEAAETLLVTRGR